MAVGAQIPNSCRAIVGTGDDESTILRVVKRINSVLVAFKGCVDPLVLDIPDLVLMCIDCQLLQKQLQCDEGRHVCHASREHSKEAIAHPDLSILTSCCKIIAIRAEADAVYTTLR